MRFFLTILIFLVIVGIATGCGKSALDGHVSSSSSSSSSSSGSAIVADISNTGKCKTQCQWSYNQCMKYLGSADTYETRKAVSLNCETSQNTCITHCSYCESHNWNLIEPIVHHWPDNCTEVFDRVLTQPPGTTDVASLVWTITNRRTVCTPVPDTYEQCRETDYSYHPYL